MTKVFFPPPGDPGLAVEILAAQMAGPGPQRIHDTTSLTLAELARECKLPVRTEVLNMFTRSLPNDILLHLPPEFFHERHGYVP